MKNSQRDAPRFGGTTNVFCTTTYVAVDVIVGEGNHMTTNLLDIRKKSRITNHACSSAIRLPLPRFNSKDFRAESAFDCRSLCRRIYAFGTPAYNNSFGIKSINKGGYPM